MVSLWYLYGILMVFIWYLLRRKIGSRVDDERNYLPFDLDNQKNSSTFALRNKIL